MASKPPFDFDPVYGAFILILALIVTLAANSMIILVGCAFFQVQAMCEKTGNNLKDIAVELVAAIAILISQRRT